MSKDYVDIELSRAITLDGAEVKSLRMREPTVGDQIAAQESARSNAMQEVTMFGNLCEIDPETVKSLRIKDYNKLREAYEGFLE